MMNQSYIPSTNGIQSFIEASPDYELAPIGLGSMREQAEKLAEYGRYGDIYVIHAAEGETVVPMEVLEANPQIKSLLFQQMAEMGLDPERYVVGNNLNSLNPVTGMPEFFFKKIWKAVKGVLPYIAPVIGNMIAPGIGGLIATGLATKLAGGSWGDALKATAIAYGTQAVFQGFSEMGGDGRGFMTGFGEGLTAPYHAAVGLTSWDGTTPRGENPLAQGFFGSGDEIFPIYDPKFQTESEKLAAIRLNTAAIKQRRGALGLKPGTSTYDGQEYVQTPGGLVPKERLLGGPPGTSQQYTQTPPVRGSDRTLPSAQLGADGTKSSIAASDTGPYLGKYSPTGGDLTDVLAAGTLAYAGGAFDEDEPEQPVPSQLAGFVDDRVTAEQLLRDDPERFRIGIENLDPNIPVLGETEVASPYTYPYTMFGAHGGTVNYPRQTGHINGPGTGTSDEIPAMLSDGEFVMTKRAVDGAGGPKTMYDLMRNFEMRT